MKLRTTSLLTTVAFLAGCTELISGGLTEHRNYVNSGRSISGWVMSLNQDQDCEPFRVFERKPVCRPNPQPDTAVCYRTLGQVNCFENPPKRQAEGQRLGP
jgi:hypothetical protein